MEEFITSVVGFILGDSNLTKAGLKELFYSNGLDWLWVFIRDYIFNYKVWIGGLLPALLLERLMPAFPDRKKLLTPNLILDAIYPLLVLVIQVFVISAIVAAIVAFYRTYLPFANTGLLNDQPVWIQAVGIFLITDLMFYVSHRTMHEVKWLWHFHTIHHCQTNMNPMTTNRVHPFESVFKTIIRTIPIGFVGGSPTTWVVFLVLNNFWGYFIHSNIRMNFGILKHVLVTPQYHRVHHSRQPEHFDKNYGERLVIWDQLFRSHYPGLDDYPETGVKDADWVVEKSHSPKELGRAFVAQMVYPFYMIYRSIAGFVRPQQTRTS
ncbi:MAG: sterol desaturase family protein [Pseudomonadota bacterium]